MAELEKVIKGLECCRCGFCFSCPYNDGVDENTECKQKWADDTLELLKAQEPKPPRFVVAYDKIFYACDNCGKSLVVMANIEGIVLQKDLPKYCNECGHAVKWDEPPKEG